MLHDFGVLGRLLVTFRRFVRLGWIAFTLGRKPTFRGLGGTLEALVVSSCRRRFLDSLLSVLVRFSVVLGVSSGTLLRHFGTTSAKIRYLCAGWLWKSIQGNLKSRFWKGLHVPGCVKALEVATVPQAVCVTLATGGMCLSVSLQRNWRFRRIDPFPALRVL